VLAGQKQVRGKLSLFCPVLFVCEVLAPAAPHCVA